MKRRLSASQHASQGLPLACARTPRIAHTREVPPQRGMTFATITASLRVQEGDHGPLARPLGKAGLQGKGLGSAIRAFGAAMGSSAYCQSRQVLPQRGMARRAQVGMGAVIAPFRPHYRPPPETKNPCKSG